MTFHLLDYLYSFVENNFNRYITFSKEDIKNLLEEVDYFINNYLENKKEISN